jgi:hypothetical protein
MRTILCWTAIAALAALGWSADNTTPAKKTTSPQKTVTKSSAPVAKKQAAAPSKARVTKRAAASGTTASHPAATKKGPSPAASRPATQKTGSTTTAARRGKKGPPAKRVTWRNRQLAPTPQRYKEIQDALAAKGYLKPEDADGTWNQASMDAMKKFQAGQNLDSSGKINSLSLIALGLGPKRETAAPKPPAESPLAPPPEHQ